MFKLTKSILNNLNDKNYLNNKDSLKLYDLSAANAVLLDDYSHEMREIIRLEESQRHSNLKVYIKNMAKLRVKQTVLFVAPILLGGLTIASFATVKYTRMETIDHVYQNTALEFDEDSLLSQEEMMYTTFSIDENNYVDENVINAPSIDTSSYALLYYGEGSASLQVKFDINDDNTWQYNSYTNYLYQKSANPPMEAIGKLDEQYKELIKEATETFIKEAELSEEEVAYLREIVSNNENDIIVKINKCVMLENMDLEVYTYHWLIFTLVIIADTVLLILIIRHFGDLKEAVGVQVFDSQLVESIDVPNLFRAALEYRQAFLTAEENRINSINSILTSNGGSDKILSKYEKKLVKENENKLEMK